MLKNFNLRERNLALALGSIVFLVLNLLFMPRLLAYKKEARRKQTELQAKAAAAKGWVEREAYWNTRKEWIEKAEPTLKATREESARQFEELQALAHQHGLKIADVQLLQLGPAEFYHPVGARFAISGPWPELVKFVSGLQNPDRFNVIPRFSVKSDDPPPNVHCELEIQHWLSASVEDQKP